jgi:transposase
MAATTPGKLTLRWQGAAAAHGDRQAERRHEGLRRAAAPLVERTFSWFGRNRRVAKDFESLAEPWPTFVTLASIQLALRRLARA